MSSTNDVVTPSERLTGRVKWFNNSTGYGFITITDGDRSGSDIFVHHSAVQVESQQYKYLVQGEYVELELVKSSSGPHEWQASNVNGIKGGKLMCETRREFKLARTTYKSSNDEPTSRPPRMPRESVPRESVPREAGSREAGSREKRVPRARGEGPREAGSREAGDKKEWTLVKPKVAPGRGRGRPPRTSEAEAK